MEKKKITLGKLETFEKAASLLRSIDNGLNLYEKRKNEEIKIDSSKPIPSVKLYVKPNNTQKHRIFNLDLGLYGSTYKNDPTIKFEKLMYGDEGLFKTYFMDVLNEHIPELIKETRNKIHNACLIYRNEATEEISEILKLLNIDISEKKEV